MGPYVARGPVGSYGMLSLCDSDSNPEQPVADDPVSPYVTRGPVGLYGMLSPCNSDSDPDQPVADGRWARMLHVARWARMGRRPRVTLILLALLASMWPIVRWTHVFLLALLACVGRHPCLTLSL